MDFGARIRIGLASGVLGVAAAIGLATTVEAGPPAEPLLPDLKTVAPGAEPALYLNAGNNTGRVILRIANKVGNRGAGPMELYSSPGTATGGPGNPSDCTVDTLPSPQGDSPMDANQRIYEDTNGNGEYDPAGDPDGEDRVGETPKVGCFEYHQHPGHDHWHLQDFAQYRLLTRGGEAIPGIDPSRKIGFCIFDGYDDPLPDLPGKPAAGVYSPGGCNTGDPGTGPERIGLSVGWADLYSARTPGQRLDISGVTQGDYCLVSVANPPAGASQIEESDPSNNERRRVIRVSTARDRVRFLAGESC